MSPPHLSGKPEKTKFQLDHTLSTEGLDSLTLEAIDIPAIYQALDENEQWRLLTKQYFPFYDPKDLEPNKIDFDYQTVFKDAWRYEYVHLQPIQQQILNTIKAHNVDEFIRLLKDAMSDATNQTDWDPDNAYKIAKKFGHLLGFQDRHGLSPMAWKYLEENSLFFTKAVSKLENKNDSTSKTIVTLLNCYRDLKHHPNTLHFKLTSQTESFNFCFLLRDLAQVTQDPEVTLQDDKMESQNDIMQLRDSKVLQRITDRIGKENDHRWQSLDESKDETKTTLTAHLIANQADEFKAMLDKKIKDSNVNTARINAVLKKKRSIIFGSDCFGFGLWDWHFIAKNPNDFKDQITLITHTKTRTYRTSKKTTTIQPNTLHFSIAHKEDRLETLTKLLHFAGLAQIQNFIKVFIAPRLQSAQLTPTSQFNIKDNEINRNELLERLLQAKRYDVISHVLEQYLGGNINVKLNGSYLIYLMFRAIHSLSDELQFKRFLDFYHLHNGDVNCINHQGYTPLTYATFHNNLSAMKQLLADPTVDVNTYHLDSISTDDKSKGNILHIVAKHGHLAQIELIAAHNQAKPTRAVNVFATTQEGFSALELALTEGRLDTAKTLIANNLAASNWQSSLEKTHVLHYIVQHPDILQYDENSEETSVSKQKNPHWDEVFTWMHQQGADALDKNKNKISTLQLALCNNNVKAAENLIKFCLNKDHHEEAAFICKEYGAWDLVNYLVEQSDETAAQLIKEKIRPTHLKDNLDEPVTDERLSMLIESQLQAWQELCRTSDNKQFYNTKINPKKSQMQVTDEIITKKTSGDEFTKLDPQPSLDTSPNLFPGRFHQAICYYFKNFDLKLSQNILNQLFCIALLEDDLVNANLLLDKGAKFSTDEHGYEYPHPDDVKNLFIKLINQKEDRLLTALCIFKPHQAKIKETLADSSCKKQLNVASLQAMMLTLAKGLVPNADNEHKQVCQLFKLGLEEHFLSEMMSVLTDYPELAQFTDFKGNSWLHHLADFSHNPRKQASCDNRATYEVREHNTFNLLIKHHCVLSIFNYHQETSVMVALRTGNAHFVTMAFQHDPTVFEMPVVQLNTASGRPPVETTCLHLAIASAGWPQLSSEVKQALANEQRVNKKSSDGKTPLMVAFLQGNFAACKYLLENKANHTELLTVKQTLHEKFPSHDQLPLLELLLTYNPKLIQLRVAAGYYEELKYLVQQNSFAKKNPDARAPTLDWDHLNSENQDLLQILAKQGQHALCKQLLVLIGKDDPPKPVVDSDSRIDCIHSYSHEFRQDKKKGQLRNNKMSSENNKKRLILADIIVLSLIAIVSLVTLVNLALFAHGIALGTFATLKLTPLLSTLNSSLGHVGSALLFGGLTTLSITGVCLLSHLNTSSENNASVPSSNMNENLTATTLLTDKSELTTFNSYYASFFAETIAEAQPLTELQTFDDNTATSNLLALNSVSHCNT